MVPRIALAGELLRRGHHPTVACVESYRADVESRGIAWAELGAHPADDLHARAYDRIMTHDRDPAARGEAILRELFVPMLPALFARVSELAEVHDVVALNDLLATFAPRLFASTALVLVTVTSQPAGGFAKLVGGIPCLKLVGSSPRLLPQGFVGGPDLEVTDFWLVDDIVEFPERARVERFLASRSDPVLAVVLATAWGRDRQLSTGLLLDAARRAGVRLVVQDYGASIADDDRAISVGRLPYAWLFQRVDAVVHHGGAGTTAEALRAGCPAVVLPQYGDHLYWAARLEAAGVSAGTLLPDRLRAEALAALMRRAVDDPGVRRATAALGSEIDTVGGVARAVDRIERSSLSMT